MLTRFQFWNFLCKCLIMSNLLNIRVNVKQSIDITLYWFHYLLYNALHVHACFVKNLNLLKWVFLRIHFIVRLLYLWGPSPLIFVSINIYRHQKFIYSIVIKFL